MELPSLAYVIDHYRRTIGLVLLLLIGIGAYGISQNTFDDQPKGVFRSDDDQFRLLEQIFRDFGSDENDIVVLVESPQLYSPAGLTSLNSLVKDLADIEGIERSLSVMDPKLGVLPTIPSSTVEIDAAKQRTKNHALVGGRLVSSDFESTIVLLTLSGQDLGIDVIDPIT